jgi:hypothetical protein
MIKPLSKWILIRAFVLALVVWFLLAAINTSGGDNISGVIKSEQALGFSEGRASSEACAIQPNNSAHLKFSYGNRRGFRNAASKRTALVSQHAVYTIVGELKERIALPFDIQVVFEECGDPDSYYDEKTHEIGICYELIDAYYYVFSETLKERTARDEAAKGAIVSMFLHEVAHALIDGWDLPITGREEDAADQFSTLLLINGIPDGDEMALDGARSFKLLADLQKDLEQDYSDPHSLDEQRFFNTICLVYGHRPEHYEYLIRNGTLPVERAFSCEEDYARLNKSWQRLLAPYLVAN